ncbi:MAG: DUF563 domain-containing protein [Rickettsiaceae bacterium]
MKFQKVIISSARKVNPGTNVHILNFSNKSLKELDINDGEKMPFYYFSEEYITPPLYLYTIQNAVVFLGEDTRRFFVFKNGFYTLMGRGNGKFDNIFPKLLEKENIFYNEKNKNIYSIKDSMKLPEIKNKTIFFHGDWNLYHIIMEPLPGLLLINNTFDYKLNLSYSSRQNTDVLKAFENPNIIPTNCFSFEKFSELIIPSPIHENNAFFPNIELMNKLITKLKRSFSKNIKIKPLGKKIYISRADASRRRVLNEIELIKHLKKRGFSVVMPGKYSVADQSKLFEEAEIIVGPHGLGLVNMLFSNNLKTVIELFSVTHNPNCYLRTAQIKGAQNYYALFHNAQNPNSTDWTSDYNVNIPKILEILDEMVK